MSAASEWEKVRERKRERERGPTKNWVPDKQYTFTSHKHIGHWATNREWERILKKCEQCSLVAEKNQPTRLQSSVYGQISFQKICERWIDWSRKFLSFYSFSLPCFTSVWSSLFSEDQCRRKTTTTTTVCSLAADLKVDDASAAREQEKSSGRY